MPHPMPGLEHPGEFDPAAKRAVYDVIAARRDIRNFRPDPVPDAVVRRLLEAAHQAGSVGMMQPWDFILLRSPERKAEVYALFRRATERAALRYDGDRRDAYASLKLQGILDAPLAICVTCDTTRGGPHVLGRDTIPEMDRYSTCLAVQNLWLAARAEGVGVGWVSIVENGELAAVLGLPPHVVPVAFLCVGYPVEFPAAPMLATSGWRGRLPLDALVHEEGWAGGRTAAYATAPEVAEASPNITDHGRHEADDPARVVAAHVAALVAGVAPADADGTRAARVRARLDALAKPAHSLGRLEDLAAWLACAQGRDLPNAGRTGMLVFAGDHGVTAEGVSAYRPEVTRRLCYNMLAGGAVINALLRPARVPLTVVDVGVAHGFDPAARLVQAKVARGTANIARGPAMSRAEALASLAAGATAVRGHATLDVLAVGEVGIGNTTAAAALLALLTGAGADDVVGAGTGVGPRTRARKAAVVDAVLRRAASDAGEVHSDPIDALAQAGGFEIGALAGAMLAAAGHRVPIVLDGFITGVAALVAAALAPAVVDYLVPSHRSAERGHELVLQRLGRAPLLELGLCLGEGSGAALALPLVEAACAVLRDVRTFAEAGIDPPFDARRAE